VERCHGIASGLFFLEVIVGRVLENVIIYLSLVFRPRVLLRVARGYLEGLDEVKVAMKQCEELRNILRG